MKLTAHTRRTVRTCVLCVDVEGVGLVGRALGEALAVDLDLAGVADLALAHEDLERRVGDVLPVAQHVHQVLANLVRRE